jgi:hypothetical protein
MAKAYEGAPEPCFIKENLSIFLNHSINFFGLLQGQILKKKFERGDSPEKSSWSDHT